MRNCSKNRRNGIRNTLKFLLDYMRAAPACSIAASAVDLVIALLPSAISVATAMVTDRIAGGFGAAFAAGAAALLVLLALNQGLYYISDLLNDYAFNRAQYRMRAAFLDKVSQLQLIEFEKTEMLDRSHRLDKWLKDQRMISYFFSLRLIAVNSVTVVSLIATLAAFSPWLILIALGSALPSLFVRLVEGKKYFRIQMQTENLERNRSYFWSLFRNGATAKEIQAYGAGAFFLDYCKKTDLDMTTKMYRFTRNHGILLLLVTCLAAVGYGGGLAAAAALVSAGSLAVSGFSACVSAFLSLQNAVFNTAAEAGYMSECASCVHEYYEFLALPTEPQPKDAGEDFNQILLQNVYFAYPESGNVLKDINFSLPKGKHVAVVGENGSGKTTLLKLIAGVYRPTAGEILLNGEAYDEARAAGARAYFTLQPQHYIKYKGEVRENIFLSDPDRRGDTERMRALLAESALSREGLKLDTQLGREYGGEELSEGQWQQLAFLRAVFRKYEVIMLDEPTGAIDPNNEQTILKGFLEAMRDKTALIVTHRLSLCRFTDEILFLEQGKITERGSHEQLMRLNGKYREMYEMQSEWYQ